MCFRIWDINTRFHKNQTDFLYIRILKKENNMKLSGCSFSKKCMLIILTSGFYTCLFVLSGSLMASEAVKPQFHIKLRDGMVIESGSKPSAAPDAALPGSAISRNTILKTMNIGMIEGYSGGRRIQMNYDDIVKGVLDLELVTPGLSPYKKGMIRIKKVDGGVNVLTDATIYKYIGHDLPLREMVVYTYDGFNESWREENLDISKVSGISLVSNKPEVKVVKDVKPQVKKKAVKGSVITVRFEQGVEEIASEYQKKLISMASSFKKNGGKGRHIYVTGHSDFDKDKERSMEISKVRAEMVKDFLVKNGIKASQIKVSYMGDKKPVATNKTPDGRIQNRRVDVLVK